MFKIGDFSRLARVTVKALRHYDELGLLPPARVDGETGYRYYSAGQMPQLHRILALKDLGFSLQQVSMMLGGELPADLLRGMLKRRREDVQQLIDEEQLRLRGVEARLQLLEGESDMSQPDVLVKKVEAQRVVALRRVIPTYRHVGELFGELCSYLGALNLAFAGPPMALYHEAEYRERDVDAEVAVPVLADVPERGEIRMRTLDAAEVACLVHVGPYEALPGSYDALMRWMEAHQSQVGCPVREVYLHGPDSSDPPETYVTEIQVPLG